jgi:hypothetical protein
MSERDEEQKHESARESKNRGMKSKNRQKMGECEEK